MKRNNILAINFNHDGSATIVSEGRITAFLNTERFSKMKKHPGIRREDLDNVLNQASLTLEDISLLILCNFHNMDSPDIPYLYGSTLKESWFEFWIDHKMENVRIDGITIPCLINPDHHLQHCALAYYTSPFSQAICFSWDPTGFGIFMGIENKIYKMHYDHRGYNANFWYANVATTLFGTSIIGAGKVMGLAPYGACNGRKSGFPDKVNDLEALYDLSSGEDAVILEENGKKLNATLAFNAQLIMEEQLKWILDELYNAAVERGLSPNLCLGGGGALNSVANQVAFENSRFERLHIHPASGDDGTVIGAALWYWFDQLNNDRREFSNTEIMYSVLKYDDSIEDILASPVYKDRFIVDKAQDYISKTARYISENKIIAWFQDSSEIGPRSLGNRSILADARNPDMKDILNSRVKFREGFRPFAPSVLNEHAEKWFGLKDSPFMLRVCNVLEDSIPSVSHVDRTARIQTVSKDDNPNYHELIDCFYKLTGVPVLINTSFNIKGESIVETPQDAINCFLNTEIDILVFKNFILKKKTDINNV